MEIKKNLLSQQTTFSDRIKELVNYYAGGSNPRFAALISINPRRVIDIVSKPNANPTYSFINSIASNLSEINLDWLILNKGKMIREKSIEETEELKSTIKKLEKELEKSKIENIQLTAKFDFLKQMYDDTVLQKIR